MARKVNNSVRLFSVYFTRRQSDFFVKIPENILIYLLTKNTRCGILCKVIYFTAFKGDYFMKDMMFPVLLDTYGVLLTDRKREILDYYYNEDYSLAEISEITGISRQGVRDAIKKSEDEIYFFESKLKIVEKSQEQTAQIDEISALLKEMSETVEAPLRSKIDKALEMLNNVRSVDKTDGEPQE